MKLSPAAEEVALFFAQMLDHEYTTKEVFRNNFFTDWRKVSGTATANHDPLMPSTVVTMEMEQDSRVDQSHFFSLPSNNSTVVGRCLTEAVRCLMSLLEHKYMLIG